LTVAQNLEQRADVVGGTIERDHLFPWVVDVEGTINGKGVLITPFWVLTAAHNVETSINGAQVSYRRTDPASGKAMGGFQNTAAGSVKVHPGYVRGRPNFDIALVRLPARSEEILTGALPSVGNGLAVIETTWRAVRRYLHYYARLDRLLLISHGSGFPCNHASYEAQNHKTSLPPNEGSL
jgi:hypothetical protein